MQIESSLEEDLVDFINEELQPSPDFNETGREVMNELYSILQDMDAKESTVDRIKMAGSVGKGTNIRDTDFDVVVFFNNYEPELEEGRKELLDFILKAAKTIPGFEKGKEEVKQFSVHFEVKRDDKTYKFDVLPGANFMGSSKK